MTQTAVLGGGCFWCVEAAFIQLQGVQRVISGYMGGHVKNPTYEQVCSGKTGHVEVAEITFDPAVISYEDLLEVFFTVHDPTTLKPPGQRRRRAVPLGDLLSRRRAAQDGAESD